MPHEKIPFILLLDVITVKNINVHSADLLALIIIIHLSDNHQH